MLTNLLSLLVLAIACFALVAAGADPIVTTADVSAGSGTCDASSGVCLGGGSTVPTTQAEVPKGEKHIIYDTYIESSAFPFPIISNFLTSCLSRCQC